MSKKVALIIFGLALLLLVACNGQPEEAFLFGEADYSAGAPAEEAAAFESSEVYAAGDMQQTTFQGQDVQERLIIREGNMNVVVEDTSVSLAEFAKMAEVRGGWVVSSEVYGRGQAKSGSITLRIPVEQFDPAMAAIRDAVVDVDSESTSSQDVTEEYVDLDARVGNLEATADRVRSFLDESKSVEEALEVNRELSRLEGEIESLKARMKYLSQSAAFSLLVVYLTPDELSQPIEIAGWQPEGVARDAFETLLSTLESFGSVAIWSGVFCLPLLLIFGIPAFLIGRTIYRRRRDRNEAPPIEKAVEAEDNEQVTDWTEETED